MAYHNVSHLEAITMLDNANIQHQSYSSLFPSNRVPLPTLGEYIPYALPKSYAEAVTIEGQTPLTLLQRLRRKEKIFLKQTFFNIPQRIDFLTQLLFTKLRKSMQHKRIIELNLASLSLLLALSTHLLSCLPFLTLTIIRMLIPRRASLFLPLPRFLAHVTFPHHTRKF